MLLGGQESTINKWRTKQEYEKNNIVKISPCKSVVDGNSYDDDIDTEK
jgi:hypothetical protein